MKDEIEDGYFCPRCDSDHSLSEPVGRRHLRYALDKGDVSRMLDFTASAGSYAYITANTQQYVRDVQVFEVLQDKFANSGIFADSAAAGSWLDERMAVNSENVHQLLRRLQGDGAGEVDVIRQINGGLRGLFHEAGFVTDSSGSVASNTPGIDLEVTNRFTGEVIEQIQVKSNWSENPDVLRQTLRNWASSDHYDPSVTLAGPKELINEAQEMGLPNRLVVSNDVAGNEASGQRLVEMVENQDVAVEGGITWQGAMQRVGGGAVIGAAISCGVSAITNYIAYRQGRISGEEAFKRIGVDAAKGAVIGGGLGGLSLVFPPGAIGIGIGILVGMQVRRVVDVAFGHGAYADIVASMGAIQSSISMTHEGICVIEESTEFMRVAQETTEKELALSRQLGRDTDNNIERLLVFQRGSDE